MSNTIIQKGILVNNNVPLDAKYFNSSNAPYTDVAEVMSTIPLSERSQGLTVNVMGVEYWWDSSDMSIDPVVKSGGLTTLPASEVTYSTSGNISATNVQAAIEELDAEKVSIATNFIYDPIALSNNGASATDLSVGIKLTETVKFSETWYDLADSVAIAPTGATLIVQIKKNGTTIFNTLLSIDATETTSITAATPYVFTTSPTVWAVGDIREYSITQIGSVVAGKGLVLTVKKTY